MMEATKDYYEILDVPMTATTDEIKKAYRKLALRYHPDKNQEQSAEEQFKAVGEAYRTLSNKTQRLLYNANYIPKVKKNVTTAPLSEELRRKRRYDMKASLESMLNEEFREKFKRFFGSRNPFDFVYDENGNLWDENLFEIVVCKPMQTTATTAATGRGQNTFQKTNSKVPNITRQPEKPSTSRNPIFPPPKYERYWDRPNFFNKDQLNQNNQTPKPTTRNSYNTTFVKSDFECPCQKCKAFNFNL